MKPGIRDPLFLFLILALLGGGLFLLSSASVAISERLYGSSFFITLRQGFAALMGLFGFFLFQLIPYRFWKRTGVFWGVATVGILALVLVPAVGLKLNGARRWIDTGFFSFQPSEIAKLSLIVFLAWWIDKRAARPAAWWYGFIAFVAMMGLIAALMIAEPDLGTFGVMASTALLMFFAGGARAKEIAGLLVLGLLALGLVSYLAPYRLDRLTVFLRPGTDPQGIGYQTRQAAIAIGSGGFWGTGYGASRQKYDILPEPVGDSIFAIVAEEFGFLGSVVILSFYLLFLWRGFSIARYAPDSFGRLVVIGITGAVVFQALIHIGAVSGILPLTGIPLPFISFGGTALVIMLTGLGIVYQIAKQS